MKYKKYLAITLVFFLFAAGISSSAYAGIFMSSAKSNAEVSDEGVMSLVSKDERRGDVYIIDDCVKGTEFAGRVYTKYYPLNMDSFKDFKEDGLKVEFTGRVSLASILSFAGITSLFSYGALPIVLKEIKAVEEVPGVEPEPDDEIDITFDIQLKDSFEEIDPIAVDAELTNNGEEAVQVCEMSLELRTLNFMIKTPESKILMFNKSRYIRGVPEIVKIDAGDTYYLTVDDITEPGLFVDEEGNDYTFNAGNYLIEGMYESIDTASHFADEPFFEGQLTSPRYSFVISDDEPQNENQKPKADFTYSPEVPITGETVYFYDQSSDPDLDELTYEWTFEEALTAVTDQNPTHVYEEPGIYTVYLKVTDTEGASDQTSKEVRVREADPEDPEDPEEPESDARIYGRVREDPEIPVTQFIPVEGALVTVYDKSIDTLDSEKVCETETDYRGSYELNLGEGRYLLVVTKEEYEESTELVEVISTEEKMVNFVLKRINLEPDFQIELKEDSFKAGEPIHVAVTMTNNNEETLKVQEMGLEFGTLDLIVETPNNGQIHYIGSTVKMYPPVIELKPGEGSMVIVDLTQVELGNDKESIKLEDSGRYSVTAEYKSIEHAGLAADVWCGELSSQTESFVIE